MKATRKKRLEDAGMKVGSAEEFLDLTAAERAAVAEGITSLKSGQGKPAKAVSAKIRQKYGLRENQPARPQKHAGGPTLPAPAGYSSWLAYAVATMDDRSLDNDHGEGHQPQWPARVTRAQMRAAARAELDQIEGIWRGMEKLGEALDLLESEFGHGKTTVTAEELETSRKLHAARKAKR